MSETLTIEPMQGQNGDANSYLIGCGRQWWLLDVGFSGEKIAKKLRKREIELNYIIFSHGHYDHIAGFAAIKKEYPDIISIAHQQEKDFFTDPGLNLSTYSQRTIDSPSVDQLVNHKEKLTLCDHDFEVLHLPGHTPGGIGVFCAKAGVLFSGDTLFAGSIGRCDLPGSSVEAMSQSLKLLLQLDDSVIVYPGHGLQTSIGKERRNNPFLV